MSLRSVALFTAVDVHVQVLGILIAAEIGKHCRFPVAILDLTGHSLDDTEESSDQIRILVSDRGQGPHVLLGHNHNVVFPEGPGVMERKYPFILMDDAEGGGLRDRHVTIEVVTVVLAARRHADTIFRPVFLN